MSNTDFDGVIDDFLKSASTRAAVAPTGSPERTAKALDLSQRSGIPTPVIELDIEKAAAEIEMQERAATVQASPALQTYVNADPVNAQISSDDFNAMNDVWKTIQTINPVLRLLPDPANLAEAFFMPPSEASLQREITQYERNALKKIRAGNAGVLDWTALIMYAPRHLAIRAAQGANTAITTVQRAMDDPENWDQVAEGFNFASFLELGAIPLKPYVRYPADVTYSVTDSKKRVEPGSPEAASETILTLAENQAAELDAAMQAVVVTKTRERAPTKIKEFVEQNAGDRQIGISAEALQALYDEQDVAPGLGDPVMGFVPDIAERLRVGLATGSDVEVPFSSYLAFVDPAIHDKLLVNIRSREGMTIEEAKLAQEEMQEAIDLRAAQGTTVYHGTLSGEITEFKPGTHFGTEAAAQERINFLQKKRDDLRPVGVAPSSKEQAVIIKRVINPKRVLRLIDTFTMDNGFIALQLEGKRILNEFQTKAAINGQLNVFDYLKEEGYDAIVYSNRAEDRGKDSYIVLNPDIIKEVDMASGPKQPAIQAESTVTETPAFNNSSIIDAGPIEASVGEKSQDLYLSPLFADAESAGMTKTEFGLYSKRLESIQAAAREADLRRLERQTTRELTQEWKQTYAEEVARAEVEFDARRDIVASRFIRTGTLARDVGEGTPTPLNIDSLAGVSLSKGMAIRGGVEPDEIAGFLGYQTGRELVEDLGRLTAEQGRKSDDGFRKVVTEAVALERASERFGDAGDRAQEVIDLIASEDRSRLLYDDLRVMQKQGGGEPIGFEEMKVWAHENFIKEPVKQARRVNFWIQSVMRNGRASEMFLLKGKIPEAFKAKNQQLLSTLMMQEAIRFGKELPKAIKFIKKYTKKPPRAMPVEFATQIQKILNRMGVEVRIDPAHLRELPTLSDFIRDQNIGAGYDIAVSDLLTNELPLGSWQNLPVQDFLDIMSSMRSLDHVGREQNKIELLGKKQELADVLDQAISNIETLPLRFPKGERGTTLFSRLGERVKHGRYELDSLLVKLDRVFFDLDLRDPDGPLMQVFHSMLRAEHFEDLLFAEAAKRVGHLKVKRPGELIPNDFINPLTATETTPGIPYDISRLDLLHMALNYGNEGNRRLLAQTLVPIDLKMIGADELFFNIHIARAESRVLDFINKNMRKEDWEWVNAMWDLFRWMKPMEDKLYLELSGVAPDTVVGLPFETPFGQQPGGYAPIVLDPHKSKVSVASERASFEAAYYKATTPNGYVNKRKAHFEPILITNVAPLMAHKIRAALHDIATRREVIQAGKLLYNSKLRAAINKHYGPEYGEILHPWLRYIANHFNEEDRLLKGVGKAMRGARKNLAVAVLGGNIKTIVTPQLGPFLTELAVNPLQVAYIINPARWEKYQGFALERSGELKSRLQNMDRDIRDGLQNAVLSPSWKQRLKAQATEFSLYLVAKIDTTLATISWLREYQRAIAKGLAEEQAIQAGEISVTRYYGSASPVNLAQILRMGESSKLMTMFYGYMNTSYNLTRDVIQQGRSSVRRIKKGDYAGARRDMAMVLADSFAVIIVPALFGYVYNPGLWDEDDIGGSLAKLLLGQLAGTIFLLRDVAAMFFQDLPIRAAPLAGVLTEALRLTDDLLGLAEDEEPSDKFVKRAITTPGLIMGLPTGQLGTSMQYFWNLTTNEDDGDTLGQWLRGITYGTSEPGK